MNGVFDPTLAISTALLVLLIAVALAVARTVNLFAVAILSGIYSLLCAVWFFAMDAIDVAFTEASVGAGIATVLFLGALSHTGDRARGVKLSRLLGGAAASGLFGAAVILIVPFTPIFGDPNSPVNTQVGMDYVRSTPIEIGVPNVVTAVLASYRGLDTLGETAVIFAAGLAVIAILPRHRRNKPQSDAEDAA
jgi:multicomponent Na+:H+ antiporter subunit B